VIIQIVTTNTNTFPDPMASVRIQLSYFLECSLYPIFHKIRKKLWICWSIYGKNLTPNAQIMSCKGKNLTIPPCLALKPWISCSFATAKTLTSAFYPNCYFSVLYSQSFSSVQNCSLSCHGKVSSYPGFTASVYLSPVWQVLLMNDFRFILPVELFLIFL
jgi:hypothetical protein